MKNWCFALETLVRTTNAQWLMMLEDDILWADGSRKALDQDLEILQATHDKVGYFSLYLSNKVAKNIEEKRGVKTLSNGLYTTGLGTECWGSQAYVLPRHTAIQLLANKTFDDRRRNYVRNRNRDSIISSCLRAMGKQLWYRVPCLVNHELGDANSSLRIKPVQKSLQTRYWTGVA